MQLKSIKLSGFKSFADSTVISIRSNLSAIVGPNGCGKSNVVDAVRWVIGETSAKQLRGQSMADVIFNGTSQRKAVGKAVIELVFDNTDGRLGGEYAAFSEVSVKREVVREGQSTYFINGTICRRRDIITLFLGTGLGPRSYAIIEQGMISKLIEAKPDEMRGYLEEVAGISKYKERRRETENRMRRTKDNLDRVNDIREELATQLRRLQRQANAAERYKVLKEQETLLHGQIKALNWQQLNAQRQQLERQQDEMKLNYDQNLSQQRHIETAIEKVRQQQVVARDKESEVQHRYYAQASDIARIEQQIKHTESQLATWKSELCEADELREELSSSSADQRVQIDEVSRELSNLSPHSQEIQQHAQRDRNLLQQSQQQMQQCQRDWENHQQQFARDKQQLEVAQTSHTHLLAQQEEYAARSEALQARCYGEQLASLLSELDPMELAVATANDDVVSTQNLLEQLVLKMTAQRTQNQLTNEDLKTSRQRLQQQQAEFTSLQALQQAALNDEMTEEWLDQVELQEMPRLAQCLTVTPGWEVAIETVLGDKFNALCVADTSSLYRKLDTLTQGKLTFIQSVPASLGEMSAELQSLDSLVQCEWPLEQWLRGVYAVATLDQALRVQQQLGPTESVVTRDGLWLGHNWMRVAKSACNEDSVLIREQKMTHLQSDCAESSALVDEKELALAEGERALSVLESERESEHLSYQQRSQTLIEVRATHSAIQSRYHELEQQQQQVLGEIESVESQQLQLQQQIQVTTELIEKTRQTVDQAESVRPTLLKKREDSEVALNRAREQAQASKQRADELGIRVVANENQLNLLQQSVSRNDRQLLQVEEKRTRLNDNLADSGGPLERLNSELQQKLAQHLAVEQEHQQAEQALNQTIQALDEKQQQHGRLLKQVAAVKDQLQELAMKVQAVGVRQETIMEQLQEVDQRLDELVTSLPEDASLRVWNEQIEVMSKRISRLGAINLAAIEEFETLRERKDYLDTQYADLEEALQVLDGAIKKIDRETRHKFKETFHRVNEGFAKLFPKIFGGGRAILELEENDYLTSGVIVKAQPPGKRNTTIHMLSGGEKALTAIALVFSMFRLNPAPFCILDEVDAPLDDVNVGRFCNLVKEMSKTTQFLVISHNKVTITMADHLMGVTMHEAGVSRVVSVDMQEAIDMVET